MNKINYILSVFIIILAGTASLSGLLWTGLYTNDTISIRSQAYGQALITLIVGLPLLIISTVLTARESIKGQILWLGAAAYFLYTYISYTFLSSYNQFFLIYVILYSISLFAFILGIISIDKQKVRESFSDKFPVKGLAVFLLIIGAGLALMWLGVIIGSLIKGELPMILETYTTLVIQGLDLGIIVPVCFVTAVLLLKNHAFGYVLGGILLVKTVTLGGAVLSMIYFMYLFGTPAPAGQIVFFVILFLTGLTFLLTYIRDLK